MVLRDYWLFGLSPAFDTCHGDCWAKVLTGPSHAPMRAATAAERRGPCALCSKPLKAHHVVLVTNDGNKVHDACVRADTNPVGLGRSRTELPIALLSRQSGTRGRSRR